MTFSSRWFQSIIVLLMNEYLNWFVSYHSALLDLVTEMKKRGHPALPGEGRENWNGHFCNIGKKEILIWVNSINLAFANLLSCIPLHNMQHTSYAYVRCSFLGAIMVFTSPAQIIHHAMNQIMDTDRVTFIFI